MGDSTGVSAALQWVEAVAGVGRITLVVAWATSDNG